MSDINFIEELKKQKEPVWKVVQKYLPRKNPTKHYDIVRDYPERQGKYLRPSLLLWAAEMYGQKKSNALLTAAAMQISEDWLLIHDDFMDHSLERRSTEKELKPTLNILYGDEIAVNAGDSLHIIMWKILGDAVKSLKSEIGWKIFNKMNDVLLTTTEGQFMELDWIQTKNLKPTEEEYYKMISIKAGYYTITGPLQLGVIIAGQNEAELKKIAQWGLPFGCAFQIWDDVMNLITDTKVQGKERGGDILEGKRTLILIDLLKKCNQKEKKEIEKIYNKSREEKTEKEKDFILDLMEKYGCIEYAKKTAIDFSEQALKIFKTNTSHLPETKAKKIIKQAISFVVNRER